MKPKRGDIREDGKIFWGGYTWYTPEEFEAAKQRQRESQARYEASNPSKVKASKRRWKQNNPDKLRESGRRQYANNPTKRNKSAKKWRGKNAPIVNYHSAMRRKAVRQATPTWLTDEEHNLIREFYDTAHKLKKDTGIPHHVDHIIPLRGEIVSGLNVPWNLQVITATENQKKYNRYNPTDDSAQDAHNDHLQSV